MTDQHDPGQLAAFAIGLLDGEEAQATRTHVAACPDCRRELTELLEADGALRGMPSEWFLDGPPPDGELVLQRTLRQIRVESRARRKRRRLALIAAAVVVLVGVGAGGVALGRGTAGEAITAGPGSRSLTGFNQSTGARMSVTVTPDAGWVRVKATIVGLAVGERCMLVVVDRRGNPYIAGSWLVDSTSEQYRIDSGVAVASGDVAAVTVRNFAGHELVIAPA